MYNFRGQCATFPPNSVKNRLSIFAKSC